MTKYLLFGLGFLYCKYTLWRFHECLDDFSAGNTQIFQHISIVQTEKATTIVGQSVTYMKLRCDPFLNGFPSKDLLLVKIVIYALPFDSSPLSIPFLSMETDPLLKLDEGSREGSRPSSTILLWNAVVSLFTPPELLWKLALLQG